MRSPTLWRLTWGTWSSSPRLPAPSWVCTTTRSSPRWRLSPRWLDTIFNYLRLPSIHQEVQQVNTNNNKLRWRNSGSIKNAQFQDREEAQEHGCEFVSLLQGRDDWRCGHCRQVQVCLLFDVWIYSEADVITYRFRPLSKTGQVQVYPQGDLGRSLKEIFHQVLHCDDIALTLL